MSQVFRVKRILSTNNLERSQKEALRCLGLRKIGSEVVVKDNPAMRGQILKVQHLVKVSCDKKSKRS